MSVQVAAIEAKCKTHAEVLELELTLVRTELECARSEVVLAATQAAAQVERAKANSAPTVANSAPTVADSALEANSAQQRQTVHCRLLYWRRLKVSRSGCSKLRKTQMRLMWCKLCLR